MKTISIPDEVWEELQRKRIAENPKPTLKELTARVLRKALRLPAKEN